jgi:hypothetical protein
MYLPLFLYFGSLDQFDLAHFFGLVVCALAFAPVRCSPWPRSPNFATFASSAVKPASPGCNVIESKAAVNTLALTLASSSLRF